MAQQTATKVINPPSYQETGGGINNILWYNIFYHVSLHLLTYITNEVLMFRAAANTIFIIDSSDNDFF